MHATALNSIRTAFFPLRFIYFRYISVLSACNPRAYGEEERSSELCCKMLDPTVKLQDCVNKIKLGSGDGAIE